jgi:signal peptidase I
MDTQTTPTTETQLHAKEAPKKEESWWDILRFALITLAIIIPIRMYIAQPFIVSGESMFPTFHDKEYLIVDEVS